MKAVICGRILLRSRYLHANFDILITRPRFSWKHFTDKNEYRVAAPLSDKHKFGYELGENRHFHHTTTDEDGVRLGCYGHVLEGKKYSTQYVADSKGYRTVPTHDLITVYPSTGGERWAQDLHDTKRLQTLTRWWSIAFPGRLRLSENLARMISWARTSDSSSPTVAKHAKISRSRHRFMCQSSFVRRQRRPQLEPPRRQH